MRFKEYKVNQQEAHFTVEQTKLHYENLTVSGSENPSPMATPLRGTSLGSPYLKT